MVPSGKWPEVAFGEIFDIGSSKRVLENQWKSEGVPFYRAREIAELSRTGAVKNDLFISPELYDELSHRYGAPQKDDLMVSAVGTLGAVYQVQDGDRFYFKDASVLRFRPSNRVDPKFVRHAFHTPALKDQVNAGSGSTVGTLTISRANGLRILLPPLDEQRRIAAILDKADALRQKRKRSIAVLDEMTQSIFLEMFGDPVALDSAWPTQKIDNICTLVRGSSPRPQGDPKYFGGPVPRLMIADITRDGFWVTPRIDSLTLEGAKKSRPAPAGTVVMAVSGDVGLVSRLAVDACIHDGFVGFLKLDESIFRPGFFMTVLHLMKAMHAQGTAGAIFQNTTTSEIKKMLVPCPPIERQDDFLKRLSVVDQIAGRESRLIKAAEELFASLQNRAFSGQL